MIALGLLAATQTTGPPSVWTSGKLRENDLTNAAIRREIARRFRATKSGDEARGLAASFLAGASKSTVACYKAALALYYRSAILGYPTAYSDLPRVWKLLDRLGDRSSPEHARVACDLSGLCSYSWVRVRSARAVFNRYLSESDAASLTSAALAGARRGKDVPQLDEISTLAVKRARGLGSGEVLDSLGRGARAKGTLLFMAGTGYNEAARFVGDPKRGRQAGALFSEVLQDPEMPKDLKNLAKIWGDDLIAYPFMKASRRGG